MDLPTPVSPEGRSRPSQIPLSFHPTFNPDEVKIEIEDLGIFYSDGTESLRGVTFSIPGKQITVLFGPAGGGKSTLLRTLNRLNDLADVVSIEGHVKIDGEDILSPKTDVIALRRRVGMVFARPVVLPMSIRQNLTYGLELSGEYSASHVNEVIEASLRSSALWEEVHDRLDEPAISLSGGQQQRLCLARVLALEPDIILLDEPTSGLDPISTGKVEASLQVLKQNYTIVIVPHSVQQAARIADYAAFFLDGQLIEYAKGPDLFTHPRHPKTQDYVEGRFG
ncbi:MAG: phosphate ABC transporter ATP-binding protein [Anaerolineales bacterium]|nr:MAG: phosphate ABC transporter ATP-binding protein [Anaerolineales bacterium]